MRFQINDRNKSRDDDYTRGRCLTCSGTYQRITILNIKYHIIRLPAEWLISNT